jgi:hypothetical protein
VTYTPQQLAAALEAAARYGYQPPPLVYSSLLPYRPPVPRKPASTEIVSTAVPMPPTVPVAAPEADLVAPSPTKSEIVPVWQALLDVSVWRSRGGSGRLPR